MKTYPKYKWEVLALLWVAFFLNQADRQVFNVVLPLIREDLQLTDLQLGTIATVFNLVYALLVQLPDTLVIYLVRNGLLYPVSFCLVSQQCLQVCVAAC